MTPSHRFLAALALTLSTQAALAQDAAAPDAAHPDPGLLGKANGLLVLDYRKITLTDGGNFDLLGLHYLHQFNDWLYWGAGMAAPMVEGNYGGFFTADVTLHAQKPIFGNWFVDAGLALGAGAGGASISQISDLSGSGAYSQLYAGFGYSTGKLNFGVNYAKVAIANSRIDDSTLSFYLQKPLSFSVGAYADAGRRLGPAESGFRKHETIITLEYSNLSQIDPLGTYEGDIGLVSAQFSQFYTPRDYLFFGLDLGYSGLIWYNQAQGGIGRRFALTPNLNLYGQLGIGSGGWVTDTIDTGPGLVLFPKVRLEYVWNNGIGASVSAGYLVAPKGSSKNWSLGAALSYHLAPAGQGNADGDFKLHGVRVSLFDRLLFDMHSNGDKIGNLNLVALQFDYVLGKNWYIPVQVAAATNEYKGYAPGYVEGLAGLGWQSKPLAAGKLQGFAQVLYGMNDIGINADKDVGALLNASVGFNYNLTDTYALYGTIGKTISLGQYFRPNFDNSFDDLSIGLGLTYRFALPT